MGGSAAVLVGSAISAVVAMSVVAPQYSLERRRQALAERAERLEEFLAVSFAVATAIGSIAQATLSRKDDTEAEVRAAVEDRLNRRLSSLRLLEESDVVAVAIGLERELTKLTGIARSKQWTRADWRPQRSALADLTDDFETIARAKLGRGRLQPELGFYFLTEPGIPTVP